MASSGLSKFGPSGTVPYWVIGIDRQISDGAGGTTTIADLINSRWSSTLTDAQLNKNPWQRVLIDDQPLPGVWTVEKMKRKLSAQVNKKSGGDGGSATIRGLLNPQFTLKGELYTPDHLQQWLQVLSILDVIAKDPKTRSQHLFDHPLAKLCNISAVVILELEYSPPMRGGPLGVTLGVLGVSEQDGATVTPKSKPVPTAAPPPAIQLTSGARAPNLVEIVPPGAAR